MLFRSHAQMPTSLNFFAINNVHHEILGFSINPVSFQALNPFWVVVASPILASLYTRFGAKGKDLTMPAKFTLGMFLCSLGFLTAAAAGLWFADAQGLTSPWFIVLVYLFQSLGELMISALGLAMVAALITTLDRRISDLLDEIIHFCEFQQSASHWQRGTGA